jgi:hypothetical protein
MIDSAEEHSTNRKTARRDISKGHPCERQCHEGTETYVFVSSSRVGLLLVRYH